MNPETDAPPFLPAVETTDSCTNKMDITGIVLGTQIDRIPANGYQYELWSFSQLNTDVLNRK